jgi:hypothetical protein
MERVITVHRTVLCLLCLLLMAASVFGRDEEPGAAWKSQIGFPDEPFQSWTSPPFVKFTIITKEGYDPNLVHFQDSTRYEYHFDFALEQLEPFIGMTVEEFDRVTLHAAGQEAVLGAVIFPPWHDPPYNEYGIQLVRNDPYTREEVAKYFDLVRASVIAEPNVTAFYFPSYEQYPLAEQNRQWFEDRGILIGSTGRWTEGNASYAQGWTLGTLKFVPGMEIQSAYTAGQLLPDDILLTDGVPAEVPAVAGIITLTPSTPNSHVAILARSQGVPFAHVAVESDAALARSLVGRCVYLAVTKDPYGSSCEVKLLDIGSLDAESRASLLALKEKPPLLIQPMRPRGAYWADTNDLQPGDIGYFGGKASNFGILRRAIPNDSPRAMAFSFDLWNAFLDQQVGGMSLRDRVGQRLSKDTTYSPGDLQALASDLASIRDTFRDEQVTPFSPELQAVVIDALETFGFDPAKPIRFRSSTNVEDSEQFTGAGLYDSYSGCLADDLDGDNSGPCTCDPAQSGERGVFRAIRRVFASFYNDNAFLERLKHGVDESQVGMALLVHHSYPDEIELANGVATMERTDRSWTVNVVSQKGAVSVTNPPMDAVPEEVTIDAGFNGPMPWLVRRSSLVPLRENTVLEWDEEYIELYNLLVAAGDRYCQVTGKDDVVLDFEFKKTAPLGKLEIKQIREIPQAGGAGYATPFLLGEPVQLCTLQGRGSDVFTNHRLKSRWTLTPRNQWLTEENLMSCIYGQAVIEYVADGAVRQITCELPSLRDAAHLYTAPESEWDQYDLTDSWRFFDLCNGRTYRLTTMPLFEAVVPDPVVTPDDLRLSIEVDYDSPVLVGDGDPTLTEGAALYQPWTPTDQDIAEECVLDDPNTGVSIVTRFYARWGWGWGTPTSVQFEQTRIEGLTSEPIVLTGFFSQSVGGGSHLCPKNFLFEPALEPGIAPGTLAELRQKNVRLIYYTTGARECRPLEWQDTPPFIRLYGFDEPIEGPACN